jgi:hypothetical protein
MLCVCGKDVPIVQHFSSTQTMRQPEANTKRQATEHNWLPLLLADGDKESEEKKYFGLVRLKQPRLVVPVRKNIFCTGPTRAAKTEQKSLVPARQAQ